MNRLFIFFLLALVLTASCSQQEPEEIISTDPYHYKRGTLEPGESLANALMDEGLENGTVYNLVNKLNTIFDLRYSQPADSFLVVLDSTEIVNQLHFMPDKIRTYSVLLDTFDPETDSIYHYYTKIDTLPTIVLTKVIEGEIDTSLWQAVMEANGTPYLAMTFTQIFQWDIDFFIDPQKGDSFKIVYEEYATPDSEYIKPGNILAAQYKTRGYDKIAYLYKNRKGIAKYYDETGKSFQKAFLKSPLNYKRITSYFGKRVHPVTKKVSVHNGVDYAAAYGTPVEATADGTVIYAAWHPNHTGNTVKIRHANGYETLYGHLSKFGKYKVGMRVQQHDIIGYVGSTGRSTGPHLHYTIYHHGKPINPLSLKNVAGPSVPKAELPDFEQTIQKLKHFFANDEKI